MSEARLPGSLRLRIEKAIYGGAGLARDEGKAIFVPYTLPGELVTATVTQSKASFAEAALGAVIEASPSRTHPPCPYFGVCGGCQYQHAGYAAQLAMKVAILEETLTRAGVTTLPAIATHAGEPFGYRNRIRLHLDPFTSALGYRERASHRLLPVGVCPIAAPRLERALAALAGVCVAQQCGRFFSQAELSSNHDESEVLLALWLRARIVPDAHGQSIPSAHLPPREVELLLTQVCEALQPMLHGAGVHAAPPEPAAGTQSRRTRTRPGKRASPGDETGEAEEGSGALVAAWGATHMTYRVGSLDYRVSLGAFFQVNRTLIETLVGLATGGRSGVLAWDLYAGVGLFSCVLAKHFERVVAVEGAPVSARDLSAHLASPHEAIRSSTLAFLRRMAGDPGGRFSRALAKPGFVLVDPPRAGLGEEATRLLAQIGPPDITYVSCDPATLSRDLRALVSSGYKLQQLHLIDLFPQTFHLETVAILSLR